MAVLDRRGHQAVDPFATASAIASGWKASVPRGRWGPCASVAPMGRMTTGSRSTASANSLLVISSMRILTPSCPTEESGTAHGTLALGEGILVELFDELLIDLVQTLVLDGLVAFRAVHRLVICFPDIFMLSPFACSLGLGDLEQVRQFAFHVENLVHMA